MISTKNGLTKTRTSLGTQSVSLTTPLPGFLHTTCADRERLMSPEPAGTFLIREDMPATAFLPKTPGRQIKKGGIKDFFSPLALEKMFEPPSPPPQKPLVTAFTTAPAVPSRLSQAFTPNDSRSDSDTSTRSNTVDRALLKPSLPSNVVTPPPALGTQKRSALEGPFTFTVPRQKSRFPQAESTPGHGYSAANPPMTDPRLRLFQLQYDTFTRDHLSAMVDSIAVNTPSGGSNGSPSSPVQRIPFRPQQSPVPDDAAIRSIKRIKLSPPCNFYGEGAGAGAIVSRPRALRVDYVGESRSLMEQIKQARDFSTVSTNVTMQTPTTDQSQMKIPVWVPSNDNRPALFSVTNERSGSVAGSSTAAPSGHSSFALRMQAANLMQQIKDDMKGSKRLYSDSGDAELSPYTHGENDRADVSASVLEKSQQSNSSGGSHERSRRRSPKTGSPRHPSSASRHHPSPRKFSRSVSDDQERSLIHDMSNMSIEAPWQTEVHPGVVITNPALIANVPCIQVTSSPAVDPFPPADYPNTSIVFVVIATFRTASGTTITASSAPSFVKHAGPVHITHITPSDVPSLPQRVGRMVYDKDLMKWMRTSTRVASDGEDLRDHTSVTDAESEDPFRDIESLREDDSGGTNDVSGITAEQGPMATQEDVGEEAHFRQDATRMEVREDEDENDQEEVGLTTFMFDGPSAAGVQDDNGDDTTESDSEEDDGSTTQRAPVVLELEEDLSNESPDQQPLAPVEATPVAPRRMPMVVTPMPPKSALKSTSATPVSAMKDPNRDKRRTPAQRLGHRRSVSFSDGKRDGPIRGLVVKLNESDDGLETSMSSLEPTQSIAYSPSVRSKRIAEMMQDLEQTIEPEETPTRSSTPIHDVEELQLVGNRRPSSQMVVVDSSEISRQGVLDVEEQLVITDVLPFEPHWEDLISIDLSKKSLDSVARLKEFLPKLDSLTLNCNQLSWLSGIPASLRMLSAVSNVLTGVTSFSHLQNLENLDISNNDIDSLTQLQCLRHLRELRADGNQITNLDGLQQLEALTKLSVQGNQIREVDFSLFRWLRLEMLDLSQNQLVRVTSLARSLPALTVLNLDGNSLDDFDAGGVMTRLRILRASNNRLHSLNVGHLTNLRTLYLDNNALAGLVKGERLVKLENLSMRNQSCRDFHVSTRQFRDVKRLYLSGNKLKTNFIEEACYNLVYLEIAACRLTALPRELARLTPNLRVLNLNYNFLEDVAGLEGLTRLKKLTMIGSRLKGTKPLIRVLQRMPDVEMVDLRMNPSTLGWYLPLLVRDVPAALQPSEHGGSGGRRRGEKGGEYEWQELDAKFRRDLPDEVYVGRMAYRGLVMRACPRIRMLDGVEVSEKERAKANQLLQGIMGKGKIKGRRAGGESDKGEVTDYAWPHDQM
ncbi:hypothetical protein JVU11DRAFT_3156 [Chiua virens]|nr:hypothetical protein JVU11DRAFT_3156 [Chiua virens]